MKTKINKMMVIRVSLLMLMVLLGLTAVAPEWLDLKDLILEEHRLANGGDQYIDPVAAYEQGFSFKLLQVKYYIVNTPAIIHHRIVGSLANVTLTGFGPAAIIVLPLWLVVLTVLYVIIYTLFFASVLALFNSLKRLTTPFIKNSFSLQIITRDFSFFYHAGYMLLSFALILSIWPYFLSIFPHAISFLSKVWN